nr:unnamed protein product [Callosobruchus analis]
MYTSRQERKLARVPTLEYKLPLVLGIGFECVEDGSPDEQVFSKMTDEQLIELVKRYPVLYDMNLAVYRDHTVRNNAWEEIAEQMNTHVEDIKNKWGKLRNCFTNALKRRRKKSGQAATNIVPWKFEKQMEFLLPHIEGRSTVTNLADTNVDDSTQDSELQFSEDSTLSPPPIIPHTPRTSSRASAASFTPRRTNKSDNDNYLLKEMVDVMKATQDIRQKRSATDMDENDYFFLSMSKQLKKLPQTDQAEIKFQLHKLIHDSEMKMLNNRERILNTPINVIENKIIQNGNKPLIVKPGQSTYTRIIIPEEENTQMSNRTTSDSMYIYNLNTNKIISNPISTQYRNDDNSLSVQYEVPQVLIDSEQSQERNLTLKEFYNNVDQNDNLQLL